MGFNYFEPEKFRSNPTLSSVKPHTFFGQTPHFRGKISVKPHTLSTPLLPLFKGQNAVFFGKYMIRTLAYPTRENF